MDTRVIVNVARREGGPAEIRVKGRSLTDAEFLEYLWTVSEMKREEDEPDPKPSAVYALIRADRDLPFREIRRVLDACENPDVRIYKIQLAVQRVP